MTGQKAAPDYACGLDNTAVVLVYLSLNDLRGCELSSGFSDQPGPWSHRQGDVLQRSIRTCIVILGFVLGKV